MLRVGLTGGLGSGKSTVAAILRDLGAEVIEADELGRALMEPGQAVFSEIVRVFGNAVLTPDGRLNRARLADLAFQDGRLQELNAIVHPAVIAAQQRWTEEVFRRDSSAVAVVESALIFEVERDTRARGESQSLLADWRRRMDRVIVVIAPDEVKIARYVARINPASSASGAAHEAAEGQARLRLAHQIPDAEKTVRADYIVDNGGDDLQLCTQVKTLWQRLKAESNKISPRELLK